MNARKHDPFAETVVLPQDELATRRLRKQLGQLSPSQVRRLVAAFERRDTAAQARLIEDQPDTFVKLQPVPEDFFS